MKAPSGVTRVLSGSEAVSLSSHHGDQTVAECEHPRSLVGLAILSAIISFLFVVPLTRDGMEKEDNEVKSLSIFVFDHWLIDVGAVSCLFGGTWV